MVEAYLNFLQAMQFPVMDFDKAVFEFDFFLVCLLHLNLLKFLLNLSVP